MNNRQSDSAIIGIGSPYGDDRAGWEVIDTLRLKVGKKSAAQPSLDKSDRDGSLLLEKMKPYQKVILIDAMHTGVTPGEIHHLKLDEVIDAAGNTTSSHGFGLAHSLALGKALKQLPRQLEIYGIEMATIPQNTSFQSPLNLTIREAIQRLALDLNKQFH